MNGEVSDALGAWEDTSPERQFEEFYREQYVALLTYAVARIDSRHDAEVLVSETFIVVLDRVHQVGIPDRSWLITVLRNKIGDYFRRAHTRRSRPTAELPEIPVDSDQEDEVTLRIDVRRALAMLSKAHQEVLLLSFWSDLTTQDAARVVGISHGAYRTRLSRAREELRRITEAFQGHKGSDSRHG